MPERERRESEDGKDGEDEDVEMENEDQAEIDRLVRESKKNTEKTPDDDVDMNDAKPSREQTRSEGERQRQAPDQKVVFGNNTKEQQEEEDERFAQEQEQDEERREARVQLPLWTARTIQASIIQCIDIAQNEDAIDSTARAIDNMILLYPKTATGSTIFGLRRRQLSSTTTT
jgi:hypothetical protein